MTTQSSEYQNAAVQSASPTQLVCMLYDTLVRDMNRAILAIEAGNIEERAAEVKHALLVLQQLEAFLDMEKGGEPAANLSRFYAVLRNNIMKAHAEVDAERFRNQIALILWVRSAWEQVEGPGSQSPDRGGDNKPKGEKANQSLSCSV